MKKIHVSICAGTTCFVMGASELFLLEDELSPEIRHAVEIEGVTCFSSCKNPECGKSPFVKINGEVIAGATIQSVKNKIEEIFNQK